MKSAIAAILGTAVLLAGCAQAPTQAAAGEQKVATAAPTEKKCRKEAPIGTRFKTTVCRDADSDASDTTRDIQNSGSRSVLPPSMGGS